MPEASLSATFLACFVKKGFHTQLWSMVMMLAKDAVQAGTFLRSGRSVVRSRTAAGSHFHPACMPLQPQRWRQFGLVASAGRLPHLRRPKPLVRAEEPTDLQLSSHAEGGRNGAVGMAPDEARRGPISKMGASVADTGGVDPHDALQILQQSPEHSPAETSDTPPSSPGAQPPTPHLPCPGVMLLAEAAVSRLHVRCARLLLASHFIFTE